MSVIGVLPASGKASRIGGIPKFCLPISSERSLLQWHVEQMLEVCDEVKVSTRAEWVPIIQNMDLNITLMVREPSTMSDAIKFMTGDINQTVLVGMPDTFILGSQKNIYKEMMNSDGDLVLGVWQCTNELKGRVGQVQLVGDKVVNAVDKVQDCDFEFMWGTMLFRKGLIRTIDLSMDSPSKQIQDWIEMNLDVQAVKQIGKYIDIGTFKGLKQLYKEMDD